MLHILASLTDNSGCVIYDRNIFMIQATGNANWREKLSTHDLLTKLSHFALKRCIYEK